jgi:hypothetical protein
MNDEKNVPLNPSDGLRTRSSVQVCYPCAWTNRVSFPRACYILHQNSLQVIPTSKPTIIWGLDIVKQVLLLD